MSDVSLIAFVVVLWQRLATLRGSHLADLLRGLVPGRPLARLALAATPLLYAGQVAVLALQSHFDHSAAGLRYLTTLPIPVYDGDHGTSDFDALFTTAGFMLGVCGSLALAFVVLAVRGGTAPGRAPLAIAVAALAAISLVAPVMATTDPYEYVATGLLGFAAYAPPPGVIAHSIYAGIDPFVPLRGVIYGPFWVLVDIAQTAFGHTIVEKIEALRITNALFIVALVAVLRACGVSRAILAGIALNPVVWFYTVANPHADIQGLLLLAGALYFARRSNLALAVLCVVAAGLVKIPYVVIGGVALAQLDGRARRIVAWGVAIACVGVISYAAAGHAYVRDVSTFAALKSQNPMALVWMLMLPIVAAAVGAMLAFRKGFGGLALLFDQAGPIAAPWYLYWGLPYALAAGAGEAYLVGMPLAATLLEDRFDLVTATKLVIIVTVGLFAYDQIWMRRRNPLAA